jgi:hypothetical protein
MMQAFGIIHKKMLCVLNLQKWRGLWTESDIVGQAVKQGRNST